VDGEGVWTPEPALNDSVRADLLGA